MPTTQAPPTTHAPLPKYSLPRYADPTPSAAHRKLPREEEADLALKNTKFTPGTRQALIALFLLTIVAVPAIQLVGEFRAAGSISRLPIISIFKSLPCNGWSVGNPHPILRSLITRALRTSASATRSFQASSLRETRPIRMTGCLAVRSMISMCPPLGSSAPFLPHCSLLPY